MKFIKSHALESSISISLKNWHDCKLILYFYFSNEKELHFPESGIEMLFIIIRYITRNVRLKHIYHKM